MRLAIYELVFFMLILKLPVLYACWLVWWAVRAEPKPLEGAGVEEADPVRDAPRGRRPGPRRPSTGPHGAPQRRYGRRRAGANARLAP